MALLKAIVRNFLLRRSCSSSPSASDLFSVTISHEQWINFISFNEMHLGLYLHPLNLKEKEVINGNGFECPLNWGSHILKPKTLETARLWELWMSSITSPGLISSSQWNLLDLTESFRDWKLENFSIVTAFFWYQALFAKTRYQIQCIFPPKWGRLVCACYLTIWKFFTPCIILL